MNYEEALNIVVETEKTKLKEIGESLLEAAHAVNQSLAEVSQIKQSMPISNEMQSNFRSAIEQAFGQLQSFSAQLNYLANHINSLTAPVSEVSKLPAPIIPDATNKI